MCYNKQLVPGRIRACRSVCDRRDGGRHGHGHSRRVGRQDVGHGRRRADSDHAARPVRRRRGLPGPRARREHGAERALRRSLDAGPARCAPDGTARACCRSRRVSNGVPEARRLGVPGRARQQRLDRRATLAQLLPPPERGTADGLVSFLTTSSVVPRPGAVPRRPGVSTATVARDRPGSRTSPASTSIPSITASTTSTRSSTTRSSRFAEPRRRGCPRSSGSRPARCRISATAAASRCHRLSLNAEGWLADHRRGEGYRLLHGNGMRPAFPRFSRFSPGVQHAIRRVQRSRHAPLRPGLLGHAITLASRHSGRATDRCWSRGERLNDVRSSRVNALHDARPVPQIFSVPRLGETGRQRVFGERARDDGTRTNNFSEQLDPARECTCTWKAR